eukprot:2181527-Prymnesium_polylepis.1
MGPTGYRKSSQVGHDGGRGDNVVGPGVGGPALRVQAQAEPGRDAEHLVEELVLRGAHQIDALWLDPRHGRLVAGKVDDDPRSRSPV